MDRRALDCMSLEDLQKEAQKFQMRVSNNRDALIDGIMSHWELHNSGRSSFVFAEPADPATVQLTTTVINTPHGNIPTSASPQMPEARENFHCTTSEDTLARMMTIVTNCMQQQQQFMTTHQAVMQQQQEILLQIAGKVNRGALPVYSSPEGGSTPSSNSNSTVAGQAAEAAVTVQSETAPPTLPAAPLSQVTSLFVSQVPEFGGTENENVHLWVQRVNQVARVHRVPDNIVLLAASSKLTKDAKKWYDFQTGLVLESWGSLSEHLGRMFDKRVSFNVAMRQIEARKWVHGKETFDQYAIEKLTLLHRLNLPTEDVVNLLIGGITISSLNATALTLSADSVDQFLTKMRIVTQNAIRFDSNSPPANKLLVSKDVRCRNCNKKGHIAKNCIMSNNITCNYCKTKGHSKQDCFKLRRKEQAHQFVRQGASSSTTGSTMPSSSRKPSHNQLIGAVGNSLPKNLQTHSPYVKIFELNWIKCQLHALIDTGSPVSFIAKKTYVRFFNHSGNDLSPTRERFKSLNDKEITVLGTVKSVIKIENFGDRRIHVLLHVIDANNFGSDLILGRDFLAQEGVDFQFQSNSVEIDEIKHMFCKELTCLDIIADVPSLKEILETSVIDYGQEAKSNLLDLIIGIENDSTPLIEDDYYVNVNLKDCSTYAYAPRKFALKEREDIREIIDNLLNRGIIKPSVSPYCARVVPIKKRNNSLRLCVDLRPLNARVLKQKYPFPLIEDCLAKLANKTVFTLLDLRDGFHQIKVHPEHTKYFSFATPDGQYEYTRLPFGFCEAPAEFQKHVVQVLQPLIRQDKLIVYIDDILIASDSVDSNLQILRETLLLLKRYGFELHYAKCQFLRAKIEFLGYIISSQGVTMSDRHTDAIDSFPLPKTVHQLQRFLGLTNYFRKFIEGYALKARPLSDLLKKSVPFSINDDYKRAFNVLKKELISYPVLKHFDPTAETELHTDACLQGLGAILLQKQTTGQWAPIAYFSQVTNKAEANYHSYELEMLAIVKAIQRFHIYLYGITFKVITDCNAIVYAVNKANLNPRIARWTLQLQNYSFSVSHRPGSKMAHVDALSRRICFLESLPLERELEYKQLQDVTVKNLAEQLELSDNDKFQLVDGLVYRKAEDRSRFVIPDSMINNLIRIHHDKMAHCGVEKTFQSLYKSYWFPSMRKKIKDYIDNCVTCLLTNSSRHSSEGEMQINKIASRPLETLHLDHFGPLQQTEDGYKYILVIIDAFTRFTWLYPASSTGSQETCRILRAVFDVFGAPELLVSDRGTCFTSAEFSKFMEEYNIVHQKIAVAAPWANGLAERVNRFVKSSLAKTVERADEWKKHLSKLQYVINNTHHSAINATPSKVLLGYDQRNHGDRDLSDFVIRLSNLDLDLEKEREISRDVAWEATNRLKEYNKSCYDDRHKKPTQYNVGDFVLIRELQSKPGTNKKLKPKYKGPYQITKTLNNNRYVVTDIPGFNITAKPYNSVLSPDKLKPWVKPVKPPDDLD